MRIRFPKMHGVGWSYQKLNRRAQGWAIVGSAVVHGAPSRVALVNMGPTPLRATGGERALAGGAEVTDAATHAADDTERRIGRDDLDHSGRRGRVEQGTSTLQSHGPRNQTESMAIGTTYAMRAATLGKGVSVAYVQDEAIRFDSSPEQGPSLPGPADLLTAAFAACILKNVERMSALLPFRCHDAEVEVEAERQDRPPKMSTITYVLRISTDEPAHRVELLHQNIRKYGTIYNTLAAVCEVDGEIVTVAPPVPLV